MRGSLWPWAGGILFFLGLVLQQIPLLLVALLVLLVRGVNRLWEKYALVRIHFTRRLSTGRAFFGEEVTLVEEITNRKPLPLPWLEVEDEVPRDITFLRYRTDHSHIVSRALLGSLISLGWYHRVTRRYRFRCDSRGIFTFGPAVIRSGDLFGFSRQQMEFPVTDRLIVYPRVVPLERVTVPSKQPLGNIRLRRHIFQDPLLTIGVRDYHPGDSLKRIHWKATARTGQLQTRLYEPTTSVDMGIFLDVRTVTPPGWGTVQQLQEIGVMAAAAIASHAMGNGYRVGLYVNQRRQLTGEAVRIAPSQHPDQMTGILEALAQVHSAQESMPMSRFVLLESRSLPWGSTLVLVTAVPTEPLLATLLAMKRAGRRVVLVLVGGRPPARLEGLPVYHVSDTTPWRQVESISLREVAA